MLHKLEIDIMQANEVDLAVDLAVQHHIPAVVVHHSLISTVAMRRLARQGQFKIIAPVDWPKGENYGQLKLRGMPVRAFNVDGFEILLTSNRTKAEMTNEATNLIELIRDKLKIPAEIRFVLHALTHDNTEVLKACEALASTRKPDMMRTDIHTKWQVGKANPIAHKQLVDGIQAVCPVPIKICGNFSTAKSIVECGSWASRIAVSLNQLESILRDTQKCPPDIREMLT